MCCWERAQQERFLAEGDEMTRRYEQQSEEEKYKQLQRTARVKYWSRTAGKRKKARDCLESGASGRRKRRIERGKKIWRPMKENAKLRKLELL